MSVTPRQLRRLRRAARRIVEGDLDVRVAELRLDTARWELRIRELELGILVTGLNLDDRIAQASR